MKKQLGIVLGIVLGFAPLLALAQSLTGSPTTNTCTNVGIGAVICQIGSILNTVIPVLITLGVVYFIWGIVQFVIADGEEAKKKGKDQMLYGIIGLIIIVAMWGFVGIVIKTFGLDQGSNIATKFVNETKTSFGSTGTCNYSAQNSKLGDLLNYATCLLTGSVVPLIFSLTIVMFLWGVVQYVINNEEDAKREKGKQFMIWGIIGLTVMVGVWGLVSILGGTFGIKYILPTVPTGGK